MKCPFALGLKTAGDRSTKTRITERAAGSKSRARRVNVAQWHRRQMNE